MKVSIIIPAYNEGKYIGETLEAVLHQDFPEEFEVIVADNASTDNTSEVARSFPGVKVLYEGTKGVQFAREMARREAKGEILACLDADSIPPRDWLKQGVSYFSSPKVVGVSGPYNYYDADLFFRLQSLILQKTFHRVAHLIVHNVFHRGAVMLGGNSFIRAAAMEKIGGFNTAIRFYGDDVDTARRLTTVGDVLFRGDLVVRSSARRFIKNSIFKVSCLYIINFIWVVLFKKPFSK